MFRGLFALRQLQNCPMKNGGKSVHQSSVRRAQLEEGLEMLSDVSTSSVGRRRRRRGGNDNTCPGTIQAPRFTAPDKLPSTFCFTFLRITILLINATATYYSVLQSLTFVTSQKGNCVIISITERWFYIFNTSILLRKTCQWSEGSKLSSVQNSKIFQGLETAQKQLSCVLSLSLNIGLFSPFPLALGWT